MGKHGQAEILAAADFTYSSNSSLGHECNQQDGLSCRSSTNSRDGGHESGRHAQAPAEDYNSMAPSTQSRAWTNCEKDCFNAVLLMDDRTKYHRVKFVVRTPCFRAYTGCLLTCTDGKIWLSAEKP
jgi:hypothetical protein